MKIARLIIMLGVLSLGTLFASWLYEDYRWASICTTSHGTYSFGKRMCTWYLDENGNELQKK